ncbi:Na+/H+ antiporter [hydrothermal vent metagenome]|uniref:Na+/H+ antiporter n=1 Tax=hydrothermal vent metagenome TaxID=652676 RepID=A0A1W1CEP4_9ZZZZ
MEYEILSLAIPLLTILLAIITKDVIISLLGGIFIGYLVLNGYEVSSAFFATFDGLVSLFAEGWITKTVIFMLLVGSIIRILEDSGAVERFISYLSSKATSIDSPKGAMLLAYIIGIVIFIESSITSMVAGTVAKPLCDKNSVSREKLAYICDSTSAPVCSLIPMNGWGALLLGLILTAIESHVVTGNAVELLVASIPFNFYAIFTLFIVLVVIFFDVDVGPMKRSRAVPYLQKHHEHSGELSLWQMVLPLVVMIIMVPIMLYHTGKGDILKGSGSTSVYYSVIFTLLSIYIYYIPTKIMSHKDYFISLYKGMGEMIPVTIILILALLIGSVIKELGTAAYLTKIVVGGNIPIALLPLLIFLISAVTAFSTGTSWGTFSIMMPIALALAGGMDLYIPLVIAAVISGGIFGDHSSPISDTTIISSMASGCDHIEHVRTQIPYALIGGVLASLAFLISGYLTI